MTHNESMTNATSNTISAEYSGQITLGITGASGAIYAVTLLKQLVAANYQVFVIISAAAKVVIKTELALDVPSHPEKASLWWQNHLSSKPQQLQVLGKDQWFSPPASGSAAPKKMIVLPCSTGTLSAICHGSSDNLLERAADVVIKERGQLILVPRETPFSSIHLENMLKLSRIGVTIMPAAPGFYHNPTSIEDLVEFMVARILDHLQIDQDLAPKWGYNR